MTGACVRCLIGPICQWAHHVAKKSFHDPAPVALCKLLLLARQAADAGIEAAVFC